MRFLLDTNVLSEMRKPRPAMAVIAWLDAVDEDMVFMSVTSVAEIRRGIELMDDGRRRDALAAWLSEDLPRRFEGRLLPVERTVAEAWGDLMAKSRRAGSELSPMDAFFAATALRHDLTLVTRNVKHFDALGIALFDPWGQTGDRPD